MYSTGQRVGMSKEKQEVDTSYTWTVKLWSVDAEHVLYVSQSRGEVASKKAWKKWMMENGVDRS